MQNIFDVATITDTSSFLRHVRQYGSVMLGVTLIIRSSSRLQQVIRACDSNALLACK